MTTCCLADAWKQAILAAEGNPVDEKWIFADMKQCEDCMPYVVIKADTRSGLRTTSATQKLHFVEIRGYFASSKKTDAIRFRNNLEILLWQKGCIPLADCGCFCKTTEPVVNLSPGSKNTWVVSATLTGSYKVNSEES